jgi:hypothetical protein
MRTDDKLTPARSLPQAANAGNSLEGYAAVNSIDEHEEIARLAFQFFLARDGQDGSAEDDWFRAEEEVRKGRDSTER